MPHGPRILSIWAAALASIVVGSIALHAQQPAAQVGTRWTETQIREAIAPVRAGRTLVPTSWPGGNRVAVCISFDVDTETWDLARGGDAPVSLSAGEFGARQGMPRILDMLDRHSIPASFYVPAVSAMLHPDIVASIAKSRRHEIGVHGWIHESLPALNDAAEEERLLRQSVDYLTKVAGKRPAGYRAPSWALSRFTANQLARSGFLYDSSMMAMDVPYELVLDGKPSGLIELPVEWILDDAPYFSRTGALPAPELIFRVYRDEFDAAYAEGSYYMLTMHPRVIGHRSRMNHLEELIGYMRSKPGVWFATAEQIASHIKATVMSRPPQ
ncbi:MAG: polysaccharide deacetylase [Vicinamibacterales bacterium]